MESEIVSVSTQCNDRIRITLEDAIQEYQYVNYDNRRYVNYDKMIGGCPEFVVTGLFL